LIVWLRSSQQPSATRLASKGFETAGQYGIQEEQVT
jgi:hypothetical protein